jgi:hypothetical protein
MTDSDNDNDKDTEPLKSLAFGAYVNTPTNKNIKAAYIHKHDAEVRESSCVNKKVKYIAFAIYTNNRISIRWINNPKGDPICEVEVERNSQHEENMKIIHKGYQHTNDKFNNMPLLQPEDVKINEQYNSKFFDAAKDQFLTGTDLYIRSPWKTGKTVLATMLLKALLTYKPDASVLITSSRRSLSSMLALAFNATDYRKIKGELTEDRLKQYPVSVWQLESIASRVSKDIKFDLIIIDEPAALASHAFNNIDVNVGAKSDLAIFVLENLIRNAKRIYTSDNGLTSAHVDAFQCARPSAKSKVLINDFKSWEDIPVVLSVGKYSHDAVLHHLLKFLDTQHKARTEGKPWFGCVIPCHTVKRANQINALICDRYGSCDVVLYTSKTSDADKQKDFADVTTAWSTKFAIIYTGTVPIGISANTKHISHVFAFFTGDISDAEQSAQMMFRAREITNIYIGYAEGYMSRSNNHLPVDVDTLCDWVYVDGNWECLPSHFGGSSRSNDSGIDISPDQLKSLLDESFAGRMWVANILERHRSMQNFAERLVSILIPSGCMLNTVYSKWDCSDMRRLATRMGVCVSSLSSLSNISNAYSTNF